MAGFTPPLFLCVIAALRLCVKTGHEFNAKALRREGAKEDDRVHPAALLCVVALKTCVSALILAASL